MTAAAEKRTPRVPAEASAKQSTSEAPILAPKDADAKTRANLVAALALRGYAAHQLAEGGFVVCRWGLHRVCADLPALAAFARQVGATA